MKKLTTERVKEIGRILVVNWKDVSLEELIKGVNIEFEHGNQ
jgi:hypothetical protein